MIKRILLPVALSDENRLAMTRAADLATTFASSVTLLHVIETVQNVPFEELEDFYEKLQSQAESVLSTIEASFQKRGLPTQRAIVYGRRLEAILDFARKDAFDLIVIASHVIDEDSQHPRWGSLSHGVAILSPCSVMLVR